MNLEAIVHKVARPFLLGGAIASIYALGACARPEPINPPVVNPPAVENSVQNETTEPIVEKPFELVGDNLTDEQYETFSKNALEDYLKVLDVYGIKKEDARIKFIVGQERYSINFFFNDRVGGAVGIGHDDFITDRREVKHETAHAINQTLFPTYHMWFDEGMANYSAGMDINHPAVKRTLEQLNTNPKEFWESRIENYTFEGSRNTPTHLIGSVFFYMLMSDYGMTEEQNRSAIMHLANIYKSNGVEMSRTDIQNAYETALDKKLDNVFDIIGLGNKILWNAMMDAMPNRDYARAKKVLNEF